MQKENNNMIQGRSWMLGLCSLLICLPLLYPHIAPYTDVFGHIGRYDVQLHLAKVPALQAWYSFEWSLIPNLGYDILVQMIGPWLGAESSTKFIMMGSQILCVLGLLWISQTLHGRVQFTAILALPLLYHFAFIYGFLNYSLSLALAFCAYAFWRQTDDKPWLQKASFAIISIIIFICHIYGWAVMCVLIGSHVLARAIESEKNIAAIIWKAARSCLILMLPFVLYYVFLTGAYEGGKDMFAYKAVLRKFRYPFAVVRDRWMYWDVATAIAMIGFIVFGLKNSKYFAVDQSLKIALIIFSILYVLIPSTLLGSALADMRLMPVIFIIGLLMLRPTEPKPIYFVLAFAFFGLRIGGNTLSTYLYENDIRQDYELLQAVPEGSRMVTFVRQPCKKEANWAQSRKDHISGLALARKHIFSNDQWTTTGGQLIQVHIENVGPFKTDPSFKIRPQSCAEGYPSLKSAAELIPENGFDYLWAIDSAEENIGPDWEKIGQNKNSALYQYRPD